MLERSATALTQVKAGNNSENSLNEMRQIVYSLYQSKGIAKKVYNNIMKSIEIKVWQKYPLSKWIFILQIKNQIDL